MKYHTITRDEQDETNKPWDKLLFFYEQDRNPANKMAASVGPFQD